MRDYLKSTARDVRLASRTRPYEGRPLEPQFYPGYLGMDDLDTIRRMKLPTTKRTLK